MSVNQQPALTESADAMSGLTNYDHDVIAWADEQAAYLRAGRFDLLDIEHLADEIEDVGKSEQREFARGMAVLLAHLLTWQYQPERRGASWQTTIRVQRNALIAHLGSVASLKATLRDPAWRTRTWADAVSRAAEETSLGAFPEECPWSIDQILDADWKPE